VLRKAFRPKGKGLREGWKTLQMQVFIFSIVVLNYGDQMGAIHITQETKKKSWKASREDLFINWRAAWQWILKQKCDKQLIQI